jgi:hypothetical protein
MKTFKQFLHEASLNKMIRNTKERDTAMLSRDRGSQSEKENRSERKSLEKKLRRKGVGFSKVVGSYDEKGEGKPETEVSYQLTRNPKKQSRKGFERMVKNIGKKKGPSGEAQHSVITQKKGKEAELHPTSEKGDSFKIGKAKAGNNPDQSIGQTTAGKVRSGKKPSSKQTQTKHKQNRAFHYSSDD